MTREEARDVLANTPWLKCNGDEVEQAVMVEIEALGALPPAGCPGGQWKLCSEEMPEEREWIGTKMFGTTISDEILITFDVNGERFVRPMNLQNDELSGTDKSSMDAFHKGWKMVAWMPLPEPYREG